jgi:hypothetical protein
VFGRDERRRAEAILAETERAARAHGVALRPAPLSPSPTALCDEDPLRNLYVGADGDVSPCVYLGPPVGGAFTRRFLGRPYRVAPTRFGNALRAPVSEIWASAPYASFRERFARRVRSQQILPLWPAAWRRRLGGGDALPDPPEPCRTCHKLLGA